MINPTVAVRLGEFIYSPLDTITPHEVATLLSLFIRQAVQPLTQEELALFLREEDLEKHFIHN